MKTRSTEKATQRAILNYLELTGVFHWRNNTGSFKTERGGFYSFGTPGSPDIFAVLPPTGRIVAIEVKDTKGRLNENQEAFRGRMERAGGTYLIARSLEDVFPLFPTRQWSPKSK